MLCQWGKASNCIFCISRCYQSLHSRFTLRARTPGNPSRNQKPNQMANRTLHFEAGDGIWWRPCNHERKLLISKEMWLKRCRKLCNLVCFFDEGLWRELLMHMLILQNDHSWLILYSTVQLYCDVSNTFHDRRPCALWKLVKERYSAPPSFTAYMLLNRPFSHLPRPCPPLLNINCR